MRIARSDFPVIAPAAAGQRRLRGAMRPTRRLLEVEPDDLCHRSQRDLPSVKEMAIEEIHKKTEILE